jgi:hypothetical protein
MLMAAACLLPAVCTSLLLLALAGVGTCRLQLDWFEVYLKAQDERGYEGSFRMFMDLQV